jgi:hypothetical protein
VVKKQRSSAASSDENQDDEQQHVIDLRGHEETASAHEGSSVGAGERASAEPGSQPVNGRLTANEWWDWASLTQKIADAQHQARWSDSGAKRPASDPKTRQPASGRLTPEEWADWVELGHTIARPRADVVSMTDDADDTEPEADAATDVEPETDEAEPEVGEAVEADDAEAASTIAEREATDHLAPETADGDRPAADDPAPEVAAASEVAAAPEVVAAHEPADAPDGVEPEPAAEPDVARAVLEQSGATAGSSRRRAGLIGSAAVGVLVLVLVLVAAMQSGRQPAPGGKAGPRVLTAATLRWLDGNIALGARLLAPAQLVPQLQAGLPRRTVLAYDQAAKQPTDLVVVSADLDRLPADAAARSLARRAVPVAKFAGGSVQLREVLSTRRSASNTATARRSAGRELVRRLSLRLTPAAWSELIAGKVDPGLMAVLERLSGQHTLDIAAFAADSWSQKVHAPARTAVLTAVDGSPVRQDGRAAANLNAALKSVFSELPAKTDSRQLAGEPALGLTCLLPTRAT